MARSVEALVEQQARRWQLVRDERRQERRRPVLTLSRQHGARGGEVAAALAQRLQLDLFDGEILHRIAESTHLSERVVSALDDKGRELLTEWLSGIVSSRYLSAVEYRHQLLRVVGAVAQHGGAIIVGRGAHLILGRGEALRVLVVAPLEARVATVARREAIPEREARRRIELVEADRRAFLLKHFHAEFGEPTHFDLVVNTTLVGVDGACAAIGAAIGAAVGGPVAV